MKTALWSVGLLASLSILPIQSEEEKALAVFKDHVLHLKNGDFGKAADGIHPKSLKKFKDSVLRRFDFETKEALAHRLKLLELESWEDAEKADPRDIYIRYQKMEGKRSMLSLDTFGRYVESIIGTLSKNGRVYIVADIKYPEDESASHTREILVVAYKHGDAWKLANIGESNIDK